MKLIVTPELQRQLRKLLGERVPVGGTETDTKFSDQDIADLLSTNVGIYQAAAAGWTEKAAMLSDRIQSYSIGQERYDMTSVKDSLDQALRMVEHYQNLAKKTKLGSVIPSIAPPQVL